MKIKFFTILLLTILLLAACNGESTNEEVLQGDNGENIKELVHNYSVGKISGKTASITSTQLIVTDSDDQELTYDLPEEEFFVSIAPFIDETHPCTNHSLTGCQGEMVEKEFDIYIEDLDGNIIIDETMMTEANGFIDIWLPREKTFYVKISHNGKLAESEISTFENDGTCITTMQLT